jgi:hypothetical protein
MRSIAHTRILVKRPTDFAALTRSDPVLVALRTLRDRLRGGHITEAEYRTEFDRLNRSAGVPCDSCRINVAVVRRGERSLCGDCALKES